MQDHSLFGQRKIFACVKVTAPCQAPTLHWAATLLVQEDLWLSGRDLPSSSVCLGVCHGLVQLGIILALELSRIQQDQLKGLRLICVSLPTKGVTPGKGSKAISSRALCTEALCSVPGSAGFRLQHAVGAPFCRSLHICTDSRISVHVRVENEVHKLVELYLLVSVAIHLPENFANLFLGERCGQVPKEHGQLFKREATILVDVKLMEFGLYLALELHSLQ
mmetsp:Transcript_26939/g.62625  ORF Transcript_26939/g.62625 Transcript_26939/m.62625 type:complete len:221 (+) Transcript_26939:246-908(+)